MERLVAQLVSSKMHGDHEARAQVLKSAESLFGVHMVLAELRSLVGPDGKQGDFRFQFAADFPEAIKIGGIPGVVHDGAAKIEDITTVSPMEVGDFAGAPMFGGDKSDRGAGKPQSFPPFHLIHLLETDSVHQVADPGRHNDRLVGGDLAETPPVEVIEMGVGDEHQVDVGQVVMGQTGVAKAADDEQPIRPVGIDKDVGFGALDQKGRMANPGQTNFPVFQLGKNRLDAVAVSPFPPEEGGQENFRDEAVGSLPPGM